MRARRTALNARATRWDLITFHLQVAAEETRANIWCTREDAHPRAHGSPPPPRVLQLKTHTHRNAFMAATHEFWASAYSSSKNQTTVKAARRRASTRF
jgi:hypothetical protein